MIKFLLRLSKYTSLILLGMAVGIALLEVGVRLVLGAKPITYLREFSRYHPSLGWEKVPNTSGVFRRGDVEIKETINSVGMRDIEYAMEKGPNVYRIMVIGDSFTEGYDVQFEDLFTEILEHRLNTEDSILTYEVLNCGTGGYSTDQELLFYEEVGANYRPDLVILMVYATNDVYYNTQTTYGNYSKPRFVLSDDSLQLTNVPLPKQTRSESIKGPLRHLALYPIVTHTILTQFPSLTRLLHRIGLVSTSTAEMAISPDSAKARYPKSFDIFSRAQPPDIASAWQVTEALLVRLHESVTNGGGQFLIVGIPDHFEIYAESWESTQKRYRVDAELWDIDRPRRILDRIARSNQMTFLDLKNEFLVRGDDSLAMYNGVHWNENGNRVVAEILFNWIRRK